MLVNNQNNISAFTCTLYMFPFIASKMAAILLDKCLMKGFFLMLCRPVVVLLMTMQ